MACWLGAFRVWGWGALLILGGLVDKSQGLLLQGNTKNDTWIFVLAILLSSTLIYNSKGTIDQQAMDQLQYPWWNSSTGDALLSLCGGLGVDKSPVLKQLQNLLVVPSDVL